MRDQQTRQSKQKLIEAFLVLMETKSFETITITDITKKAGVARLTFYRHFESKEAVLLAYLDSIFEIYLEELSKMGSRDLRGGLCRCFEYWQRDKRLPNLLAQHGTMPLVQQSFGTYFQRVLDTNILPHKLSYFQRRFIEGGLLSVMMDWIADPQGLLPKEMADLVLGLISICAGSH